MSTGAGDGFIWVALGLGALAVALAAGHAISNKGLPKEDQANGWLWAAVVAAIAAVVALARI